MIALLAILVGIYGRVSLGRNIGFVPAQRQLVTRGAYRFVRHPIYTGNLIGYTALLLHLFSLRHLIFCGTLAALFMVKSIIEERFLQTDSQYAAYMSRVPWRWFPGLI
ncbi:MAG: hypothetical protein A3H94_00990 [Acidobacteria bacterium RIFCSPLOWO2_02_FULL_60_20]|nr:MAG: hypothetical protein A3H94_00990 [Acidobacteria bacterium RIFCSPLOWO2_02_FULL_60_20]